MDKTVFLKEYLSDQMAKKAFNENGQMEINIFEIFSQRYWEINIKQNKY